MKRSRRELILEGRSGEMMKEEVEEEDWSNELVEEKLHKVKCSINNIRCFDY